VPLRIQSKSKIKHREKYAIIRKLTLFADLILA
jgi:hypothetical protein